MSILRALAISSFLWASTFAQGHPETRKLAVSLRLASALPFSKVPLDPWIDFSSLAREAGFKGVLDPNSIRVREGSFRRILPHALGDDFDHGPRGRVQWVVEDPDLRDYELQFELRPVRPALEPRRYIPMIGTGDLLRYNHGTLQPIALPILGALVDLTGDGKRDLVGTVIYTYSPDRPPGGIVCYPRVGSIDRFEFADPVAIRYLEHPQSNEARHLKAGYLHLDAGDLNGDGLVDLAYTSPARGSHQNPRSAGKWIVFLLNTGRRDEGGLPVFLDHGRIKRPESSWEPLRIVDLDQDGITDLVAGSSFIRNANPEGWPFQPDAPVTLDQGRRASFYDVDRDGRLDSVCLVRDQASERLRYFERVAWRRNLGGPIPRFGPPRLLREIDASAAYFTASVRSGPRRGLLVAHDHFPRVAFFEQTAAGPARPSFRRQEAVSISAQVAMGDQATPYPCDWDGDGDWDLLVGNGHGFVRILINQGSVDRPVFGEVRKVLSEGEPIRIFMSQVFPDLDEYHHNMGYPHPVYVDWDGDRLPDLMLPNITNRIYWYRNVGTRREPRFGPRLQVLCQGYPDSPELLAATSRLLGSGTGNWKKRVPNRHQPFRWRARAAFADVTGDGLTDLITAAAVTRDATLFAQSRDSDGRLKLHDRGVIRLPNGGTIKGVDYQPAQFSLLDWNGDGLQDVFFNHCRRKSGDWDHNPTRPQIYLNIGSAETPRFGPPMVLAAFGVPLEGLSSHGPYYGFADLDGDGKPDFLACPEMGTYLFYRHAVLKMKQRPSIQIGEARRLSE